MTMEFVRKVIEVYTDGATRNNQQKDNLGAWAYTMKLDGETVENYYAERYTTNNIQEMKAAIEAMKRLQGVKSNIQIMSDSAYLVNGMNQWRHSWKAKGWKKAKGEIANLELWKELDRLTAEFPSVAYIKVKGHSDNEGNNRADYLVNKAMDEFKD